jgi:carbon-monoxide dehydrogenase medium subunit
MTLNAHPELPEFEYLRPTSLTEASRFLAEHAGEARPLLGGTDIFVRMRDGFYHDQYLVDVKYLEGVQELRYEPEAGLTIGAAVNMNRVMAFPAVQQYYAVLAEACRSVASYQLRTRATIAGNICNASPAGDTIGASLALQAVVKVYGLNGYLDVPLAGFFLGPGKTVLQPGDIVTQIFFPAPKEGSQGTYLKLGRNTWSDLSIVGVTAYGYPAANGGGGAPSGYQFRLALASVAPVPMVPTAAQEFLAASRLGPEAFKVAGHLAAEACNPIDDVRGSARYRKAMVQKLTQKALEITWERLTR